MTITTTSSAVPQAKKQRKPWIDNLRGLAMILVLLAHTEIYYRGEIVNYNIYGVDCLIIFFFLSGYLMYRETEFNLKNKVKSVFRYIVLPYFIFTIALSLPKSIVYGASLDIPTISMKPCLTNTTSPLPSSFSSPSSSSSNGWNTYTAPR